MKKASSISHQLLRCMADATHAQAGPAPLDNKFLDGCGQHQIFMNHQGSRHTKYVWAMTLFKSPVLISHGWLTGLLEILFSFYVLQVAGCARGGVTTAWRTLEASGNGYILQQIADTIARSLSTALC